MLSVLIRVIFIITFSLTLSKAWAQDKFGYIRLSPSTLSYGISWGYTNPKEAFLVANKYCLTSTNVNVTDCKTVQEFKNTCAALALGKAGWGTSWGNHEIDVKKLALSNCKKYTTSCEIKEYVCSY